MTSKGSGPIVKKGDKIHAHYKGTLEDGTKFDSSYDRGKPLVFTVGQGRVIRCWDLGIVGIREGSKAELVCPPEYAYGSRKVGPIPPNSVLNFTIEVIKIETKKKNFAKTMWWMKKAPARPKYKRTITVEGEGPELKKGDTILAHYKVTLKDGTKLDSSYDRKKPIPFTVGEGRMIKCWDVAFAGLKKGSKAEVVCPPSLAYGSRARPRVPANSVLLFTLEVVDILPK